MASDNIRSSETEGAQDETPTVTFGPSAAETVAEELGFTIRNGYLADDSGEFVAASDGEPIELDELAGFEKDEDGNPVPVRDDFVSIVEHVKRRQNRA